MKIALLSFTFLISLKVSSEVSSHAEGMPSCKIELFSKIYTIESNHQLITNSIIKQTSCENKISLKLSQIISNSSGTTGTDFLRKELEKDFLNYKLEISPRRLSLFDLNVVLRDQLTIHENIFFFNTKSLNALVTIGLSEGEQLKAYCENCNSLGEKNVKIDITNTLENTTRTLWFTTQAMAKVKVFKAKRNISYQEKNLQTDDFYIDEIYTNNPDNTVTNINTINFYKVNHTILQGSVVSSLDLQPVNLINYNTPVTVLLKNENIYLQKKAMPLRSAQFGDVVELKNPNSNKIISGKVVDYNKVVIEL